MAIFPSHKVMILTYCVSDSNAVPTGKNNVSRMKRLKILEYSSTQISIKSVFCVFRGTYVENNQLTIIIFLAAYQPIIPTFVAAFHSNIATFVPDSQSIIATFVATYQPTIFTFVAAYKPIIVFFVAAYQPTIVKLLGTYQPTIANIHFTHYNSRIHHFNPFFVYFSDL